ncbi:hypothetical protein BDA96_04G210000 [Sorghum bicolor]|uniref:Uncharacterized protein n=1 Tax=Sorghum bicolor TaxID=4558 RepID=A0A921R420_SORBI|nr:hypothetical protein BDA96_04G210000 [Sorghum bicolor]
MIMQELPSEKSSSSSHRTSEEPSDVHRLAGATPSTIRWELGTPRHAAFQTRGVRVWPRRCRSQSSPIPSHAMPLSASTPRAATHTAVYVAAVPLRAPRGPAQLLMSAGYSLGMWDLQHFMVLLRPDPALPQALVFDFQPRDPEDALAALAVLSRREIPGVVRRRTLRRVPDRRCWLVGHCCCDGDGDGDDDAVAAAGRFSERWPTGLVVGEHDCRDYTNGLVEVLTGEKRVLESLRLRDDGS